MPGKTLTPRPLSKDGEGERVRRRRHGIGAASEKGVEDCCLTRNPGVTRLFVKEKILGN